MRRNALRVAKGDRTFLIWAGSWADEDLHFDGPGWEPSIIEMRPDENNKTWNRPLSPTTYDTEIAALIAGIDYLDVIEGMEKEENDGEHAGQGGA